MARSKLTCPNCGGSVSDRDRSCRVCGHHLAAISGKARPARSKSKAVRILAFLGVVALLATIAVAVFTYFVKSGDSDSVDARTDIAAGESPPPTKAKEPRPTASDETERDDVGDDSPSPTKTDEAAPTSAPSSSGDVENVPRGTVSGLLVDTVDGDTVIVQMDRSVYTVDLRGIVAPDPDGDCYGPESLARLNKLVPNGSVLYLDVDPRLVSGGSASAMIWYIPAGADEAKSLNEQMVYDGAAVASDDPGLDDSSRLRELESRAREGGRGLWGICDVEATRTDEISPTIAPFRGERSDALFRLGSVPRLDSRI
jgi:endonuclease YncB( thermonuclease family)